MPVSILHLFEMRRTLFWEESFRVNTHLDLSRLFGDPEPRFSTDLKKYFFLDQSFSTRLEIFRGASFEKRSNRHTYFSRPP